MKKVLLVSLAGVVLLLLTGCGGGGGGTPSPTVRFVSSMTTDIPGWSACSFSATDVEVEISNIGADIAASGIDSMGDAVEVDLVFYFDLSMQAGAYNEAGYGFIATKNAPTFGNIGTISIYNLRHSSSRVSGNFRFTTSSYITASGVGSIAPYSLTVEGTFDVPAGHWVYQNGQWQQISKEVRRTGIFEKLNKTK